MILSSPFSRQNKSHQTWHHASNNNNNNNNATTNGYSHQNGLHSTKSPLPRHQFYSSSSLRKPAPLQPAPQRPAQQQQEQQAQVQVHVPVQLHANGLKNNGHSPSIAINNNNNNNHYNNNRASTLNRLDLLKRRQQQQQQQQQQPQPQQSSTLRRNLSSLGHYPSTNGEVPRGGGDGGFKSPARGHTINHHNQIYSPASIASPRELASYPREQPPQAQQQQHYASTSVRNHPLSQVNGRLDNTDAGRQQRSQSVATTTASTTNRPESALGQLWDRTFGTLRRKAHWRRWPTGRSWSRSSNRRSSTMMTPTHDSGASGWRAGTPHSQIYAPASIAGYPASSTSGGGGGGGDTKNKDQKTQSIPAPPQPPPLPGQPLVLDPEIYASGKRQVEPEAIYAEGSYALDSNAERRLLEHELHPELMAEGETRTLIDEQSQRRADFRQLVGTLTSWINDELALERIIVRDLQDDLHDGQVLCKLVEKLHGVRLDIVEVTQNEAAQRQKLQTVLGTLNRVFASSQTRSLARIRWSVEGIHGKNLVDILHLLITMALFYRAPLRLPANVSVSVLVFQKYQGELVRRSHQVELTDEFVTTAIDKLSTAATTTTTAPNSSSSYHHTPSLQSQPPPPPPPPHAVGHQQRDAFDTLIESAPPEKLEIVKRSLVKFCQRHLNKINMMNGTVELEPRQFSDGLLLVFLISSLEDYFVPLGNLFTTISSTATSNHNNNNNNNRTPPQSPSLPYIDANNNNHHHHQQPIGQPTALEHTSYVNTQPIEKLHNVNVALQLIEEAGLTDIKQRVRAEEIINGDLKAVLRVLYALFSRYKHL